MTNQTLYATETLGQRDQLQLAEKLTVVIVVAQFERQHHAAITGLKLVDSVAGVGQQSRVIDAAHGRVVCQILGYLDGIVHMTVEANPQGLYTSY